MASDKQAKTETPAPEKLDNPNVAAQSPLKLNVVSLISPFWGWIIGHWKIAIFLILALVIFVQYELIAHYKAEAKAYSTAITTLTESLTVANNALADQNKQIQDAKAAGEVKQKQLDDLQVTINTKNVADQKIIDALRKRPVGTTCQDALDYVNNYIGEVKW